MSLFSIFSALWQPLRLVKTVLIVLQMLATGAALAAEISTEKLKVHVVKLASEIGERNVFKPDALRRAANYLRAVWVEQGYRVNDHSYRMRTLGEWANLEVTIPGAERPEEIVVIGAHYDSVLGSPGANDNGSGVAALLELSRVLAGIKPKRTLRFVAFVNEEPPFFKTASMGSRVYAAEAHRKNEMIVAMLSLETIGYFSDRPGSQHYPPFFRWFYPDRGNFIGFVANFGSRALMKEAVAAFRAAAEFPVEHVATFGWIPGMDWSDHGSFWDQGYPALMVTDTALYRYPHYHSAADTPDKLDYARLKRVTEGLKGVVASLANPQ
jgi:hypothetical protein